MPPSAIEPISWQQDAVVLLDQTRLPHEECCLRCERVEEIAEAIRALRVRGAPLIGIAAAYGIALAARAGTSDVRGRVVRAAQVLRATRPTARNLFWAIERMMARAEAGATADELLEEARAIHREDAESCRLIGEHGRAAIPAGAGVLTICNTGALATGGEGTALAAIKAAHAAGDLIRVFACETRPLLQGARLTMWELQRAGIPVTLICDSMAATVMQRGLVQVVVTGADRIARNGDAANKIGTLMLAVLARHFGLPFYIAAPMSTVDCSLATGADIPIEERDPAEVTHFAGVRVAPHGAAALNPAFDITPAALIAGVITERGIARPPYEEAWGR